MVSASASNFLVGALPSGCGFTPANTKISGPLGALRLQPLLGSTILLRLALEGRISEPVECYRLSGGLKV